MNLVFQKDFNNGINEYMLQCEQICKDLNITFCPVVLTPFVHTVDDDEQLKSLTGDTIVYGSNVMSDVVRDYNLKPGIFEIPHDESSALKFFGDHYINSDMIICNTENYDEYLQENQYYFVKPKDEKYFPGTIVDKKMMPFVIQSQGKHFGTPDIYDLCISKVKYIEAEWRFFVVNGKIVTGSKYHKEEMMLDVQPGYEYDAKIFADRMLTLAPDLKNFVIDIAKLRDGSYKVVELNCLNSSGFYKCDLTEILRSLKSYLEQKG